MTEQPAEQTPPDSGELDAFLASVVAEEGLEEPTEDDGDFDDEGSD